ncbi:flavin reductase [Dendrosporobacter sp. 1207_IL3150]|uniref:flavin reductase n=1 Tax=Dendrosporobacter sp. 1207_IL3150 TaxID=3084054 RepID=UPI002FDB4ED9
MKTWRCMVCGYEHVGEEPPDICPICGVAKDEFTLKKDNVAKEVTPIKRWKCTVCDYIHTGDQPPDSCPLCGVGRELFILLEEKNSVLSIESILETDLATIRAALTKISYGLYIITSVKENNLNGMCANSVFQLTDTPPRIAVCINKNNLTHEYIEYSGTFVVSILGREHISAVKNFGYQSGRNADKFANTEYLVAQNRCPILKDCIAYLEASVIREKIVDVGTHTLFVADITSGRTVITEEELTYSYYRQNKNK